MTFYQTTSGVFIGLLVAVLLRADIVDGDARAVTPQGREDQGDPHNSRRLLSVVVVSLAMAVGEVVSLLVLFNNRANSVEHIVVGMSVIVAIGGITPPALITVLRRAFGPQTVDLWMRRGVVTALSAVFTAAAFLAGALTNSPSRPASLLNPRFYRVYGTCAAGACGLNERVAPSPKSRKLGELQDGALIGVICQVMGYPLAVAGHTSAVWDQLSNAAYVSDVFVSTPRAGRFSPELSRCPASQITNDTQG